VIAGYGGQEKMITTIIFDIGNVLADFAWKEHIESFGYDTAMVERISAATVKTPIWNELDRGEWSYETIIDSFVAHDPEIEADIRRVLSDISTMVTRNDYAIPWIQDLKQKGYRCLYLSNYSEKAAKETAGALDFLPYLDGGILSYKEKLIKPMPEIYQLLIDRYDLIPEECVFMDDMLPNVEGAQKFGIHTIQFKNQAQAIEELRALGVNA
jgi:putative hydrolase of the HAD superfamily